MLSGHRKNKMAVTWRHDSVSFTGLVKKTKADEVEVQLQGPKMQPEEVGEARSHAVLSITEEDLS